VGLIKPLTRWVLAAVRRCRRWEQGGRSLPVAVNLSARNLQDTSLVTQISVLLAAQGVAADRLRVELTESAVTSDPGRAVLSLRQLRIAGIGMAGSGNGKATIVRSTSDLGHNLRLTVVAEGVEDEPTLELLGSYGCDAAQGYHIAR